MESQRYRHFGVVEAYKDRGIKMPIRSTKLSAGYDIFCADEEVVIPSMFKGFMSIMTGGCDVKVLDALEKLQSMSMNESKSFVDDKDNKEIMKYFTPTRVNTGIKVYMEEDEMVLGVNRSGNPSNYGLILANGLAVIDADYVDKDGQIIFQYYNFFPYDIVIHKGDKIGQIMFTKYSKSVPDNCTEEQRSGGLGSTGV